MLEEVIAMRVPRHLIPLAAIAGLGTLLMLTGARAQSDKPYEPQVGQEGKDVIWVPTPQALVDRMLAMGKVTAQDYVIDLGSGDGRTVITAAKLGAKAHGIEYNEDMVKLSRLNAEKEGVANRATFTKADIFESDYSQASVITMFLLEELNRKLRPQLLELKPGTRIVSNTFDMGEWKEDDKVEAKADCTSYCRAFLWIIPAKVGGEWTLVRDGDAASKATLALSIEQQFQILTGSAKPSTGAVVKMTGGRVRGSEVAFKLANADYSGKLDGNMLSGTFQMAGRKGTWTATKAK
jgi:SAM-dependent methyltransferase